MRKILNVILSVMMIGALMWTPSKLEAKEKEVNLALNKEVVVSGVEGGNNADGSLVYPQFDPSNLTDGNTSTRWSSDISLTSLDLSQNPNQNVWAYIDLGESVDFDKVVLRWQNANSRNYDIQYSQDATNWELLKHYEDPNNTGKDYNETLLLDEVKNARYIRIYARLGTHIDMYDLDCPTISLYEIEVYKMNEASAIEKVMETVMNGTPSANEDYTQLILPETGDDTCHVRLYSTSNPAVVSNEGKITRPLEDMSVNLFYEVYDDNGNTFRSDEPQKILISGQYSQEENDNERPKVVPAIREWKGKSGYFNFTGNIIIQDETLRETANQIAMYFKEMIKRETTITVGTPQAGDIYFQLDANSVLGDEGYSVDINDIVNVSAKTSEGILYGGTTLCQMFVASSEENALPKGLIRDYPQYEIRAVMIDVARLYIPLEHLEEMTKYAGYFKLSEFRNHINDNGGEQGSAFRVESKVHPELNDGIICYSQEDYKAYQKAAKKFGVDVVTEIDTPAHAGAFSKIDPNLLMDGFHLDLRTDEAFNRSVSVLKEVFDEFLDGDDPVFQNNKFHIGTDEYDKAYSEKVRLFMNELINYVNGKGYDTRFWASLGTKGFGGPDPVSNDVLAHMWSHAWASFDEMKEAGYKFINNADGILYTVPLAGYYNDYLNIKNLYDNWEVSDLNGGYYLQPGHPQLLGAESALWYDIKAGASEFDAFDRFKDQIIIMAEKGWSGDKTNETGEDFMKRVEIHEKYAPQANPARYVESKADQVVQYDFNAVENGIVKDLSGNGYDATIHDLNVKNGTLKFNGKGYLSLPFESLGYPYSVQFDMTIDAVTLSNALIFEGKDGKLFFDYDGTGKLGYERKGYAYLFDYEIPTGVPLTLTIICDNENATLYVNGVNVGNGAYYQLSGVKQASSTFVLPVEKIGAGIYGSLDDFKLYDYCMTPAQVAGREDSPTLEKQNVALHKEVSVSAVEGGYDDQGNLVYPQFNPQHATDGDKTTRISLNRDDNAWVMVDLGKPYLIEDAIIRFHEMPNSYEILTSEDGNEWVTVAQRTDLAGGTGADETITFNKIVNARYVKYQQTQMFDSQWGTYSGNFKEFEIYGYEIDPFLELIDQAKETLANYDETPFIQEINANVADLEEKLKTGPINDLSRLADMIKKQLDMLVNGNIPEEVVDKSELEVLIGEQLDKDNYSSKSWKSYQQALEYGKNVFYDVNATKEEVTYACESIEDAKQNFEIKQFVEITTNQTIYQDYGLNRLIDNDTTSLTWLQGNQTNGEYIKFSFRDVQRLHNIKIYSTNAGLDIIKNGRVEWSMDDTNWNSIATIGENELEDLTFDEIEARYVRIIVAEDAPYWWKITEVVFNGQTIQDKLILEQALAVQIDESLYTSESYNNYLSVKAAAQAVYDDSNANQAEIDEAVEQLQAAKDQLQTVINKAELQDCIDHKVDASIYTEESYQAYLEAYQNGETVLADDSATQRTIDLAVWQINDAKDQLVRKPLEKDALNEAIATAEALDEEAYKAASWAVLSEALDAAKTLGEEATQADVDHATSALNDAIDALVPRANTSELSALIEQLASLVESEYTIGSWTEYKDKLDAAKEVIRDIDNKTQDDVTKATEDLNAAHDALVSIKALKAEVEQVDGMSGETYTTSSWSPVETANNVAKEVLKNPNASKEDVKNALDILKESQKGLVARGNATELNTAISNAEATYTNANSYTKNSWDNYQAVLTTVKDVQAHADDKTQAQLDAAKTNLENAIEQLVAIDKSGLLASIQSSTIADIVEANYTASSWKAFTDALEDAQDVYDDPNSIQNAIDTAKTTLDQAKEALVSIKELKEKVASISTLNQEAQTTSSWAKVTKAKNVANTVIADADATKEEVTTALTNLQSAIEGLVPHGDATQLQNLVNSYVDLVENEYTKGSWANYAEKLANANAVITGIADKTTTDVTNATNELTAAKEALVSTKALKAEVDKVAGMDDEAYTTSSWAPVETANNAAKEVLKNANATKEEVKNSLDALKASQTGLVARGDASELSKLVDACETLVQREYTTASWNSYKAKLDVAKEVVRNIADQTSDDVETAKSALEAARDALVSIVELKEEVDKVDALDKNTYTTSTWSTLADKKAEAEAVLNSANATNEDVKNALDTLKEAQAGLIIRGDASELSKLIKACNDLVESEYTTGSWSNYKTKLDAAKEVVRGIADQTNEDVTIAKSELETAKSALVSIKALKDEVDQANKIDLTDLTDASKEVFNQALNTAKEVLAKPDANQEEIVKSLADLQASVQGFVVKPAKVQGVDVEKNTYSSVKLSWSKVEGATGYEIARCTSKDGEYSTKVIVGDVDTAIINKLKTGKTYYFKVRAIRKDETQDVYGDYSSVVNETPLLTKEPVISSVEQRTYGTLKITWKGVAGAQNYYLERRKAGENTWKHLKTFASSVRSAESRSLETNTMYYYRVRVSRNKGDERSYSPYSNVMSNTPVMKTTKVTVEKRSSTSARLSWKTVSGANGYEIYRATSSIGTYVKLKTVDADKKSYVSKSLEKGTTYYYKVRAYRTINGKKVYNNFSKVVSYKA